MVHISEKFFQEVELMCLINRSYKNMEWQISLKELPSIRYDDWGDEVQDTYDRNKNIINFELEMKNYDKENMHIARYEITSENGIYYDDNGFLKAPYILRFELNDNIFSSLYNTIEYKQFNNYLERFYPELKIDDETYYEEYLSEDQCNELYFISYFHTFKKIAERMVDSIKLLYKTEDKIIKVYADTELLIKSDEEIENIEEIEKIVTNKNIEEIILNAEYFYIPYVSVLNKAINNNDISILKKEKWWRNMSKYVDIKNHHYR